MCASPVCRKNERPPYFVCTWCAFCALEILIIEQFRLRAGVRANFPRPVGGFQWIGSQRQIQSPRDIEAAVRGPTARDQSISINTAESTWVGRSAVGVRRSISYFKFAWGSLCHAPVGDVVIALRFAAKPAKIVSNAFGNLNNFSPETVRSMAAAGKKMSEFSRQRDLATNEKAAPNRWIAVFPLSALMN